MIIDLYKYVKLLLPPRLRVVQLIELLRVLTSQIPRSNNDFDLFLADANYRVNVNASTIALEKLISYELDALATITELDGKPFDFLVTVHTTVDENRLKALINEYRLAGKSYIFKLGTVAYAAEFTNYECEDIIEAYTAEFTDYVCEDDKIVTINVFPGFAFNGYVKVVANAGKAVSSDLTISGNLYGYDDNGGTVGVGVFSISMDEGESSADTQLAENVNAVSYFLSDVTVTPTGDDYYDYELNVY